MANGIGSTAHSSLSSGHDKSARFAPGMCEDALYQDVVRVTLLSANDVPARPSEI